MNKFIFIQKSFIFGILIFIVSAYCGCDDSGDVNKNQPATVHGRVVNDYGSSISGATVSCLKGGTQVATTASDGSFTMNRIWVPYDLYLVYLGKAVVYKDVKSLSPNLNTFNNTSGYDNYCRIDITVPPINSNQVVSAWFVDTTGIYQGDSTCVNYNHISFNVGWQGANVMVGRVMVLVYTVDNNDRPVTYDNYGEKTAALVNTGICSLSFSPVDINIDPGESTINCQLFVPSGTSNINCSFYVGSKPFFNYSNKGFRLYGSDESSINYSIIVPDSGNKFRYYLQINTSGNGTYSNRVVNVQRGNSTVSLENPAVLIGPQGGINGINYSTEFSFFSDNNNGLYRTVFSGDSTNSYCVNVLSKTPNTTIPDLKFLGIYPDPQKNYTWRVLKYSNLNNIDDFVLTTFALSPLILSKTASETRTFMFASDPK